MRKCSEQVQGEFIATGEAEKTRKRRERLGVRRQRMGLLVSHHLQPVLDTAQEIISRGQLVAGRRIDPAAGSERVKRRDGAAAAQFVVAAAGDQLLGLREELDLANAAAAELDVVALDRDFAVAAIGMDLPLHLMHIGDGRVIEIFSPDEGGQIARGTVRRPQDRRRRRAP